MYNPSNDTWTDASGTTRRLSDLSDDHLLNLQRFLRERAAEYGGFKNRNSLKGVNNELERRNLEPLPDKTKVPGGFRVSVNKNLQIDLDYDSEGRLGSLIPEVEGKTIKEMFVGGIGDCFLHINFTDGTYIHLGVNDIGWWDDSQNCKHVKR